MARFLDYFQTKPNSWEPSPRRGLVPPQSIRHIFERQRPQYLYPWGVRPANLKTFEVWRETGEWAAIYGKNVQTPFGIAHEKYTWVLRGNTVVEIRQRGLLGINHRQFVGMIHVHTF